MPEPDSSRTPNARVRRRSVRRLVLFGVGIVVALGLVAAGGVFAAVQRSGEVRSPQAHVARASAGAVLPSADETPLPPNAIYVSADAGPRGSGSVERPLATVAAALDIVRRSATIVLRGGTYHENVFVGKSKQVVIRAYPGEEVVFDGSRPLTDWTRHGDVWTTPWTTVFDSSPSYNRGGEDGDVETWQFIRPEYPLAAHPEQVWIDGERLQQVKADQVDEHSFAVDTKAQLLSIGVDPTGREVRGSELQRAFTVRSPGSELSGITVRRYSPSIPDLAAIVLEGDGDRLVDVAVEESSTIGIFVTGTGSTLERVTARDCGLIGATANFADHLTLDNVLLARNNTEHFFHAPVSGGFKITRSQHLVVRNSTVEDNDGHGIWIDQSVLDAVIVSTDVLDNAGHGIFAEISNRVLLADVVVAGNLRMGVKINDTGEVAIWRSTIVGNGLALAVLQDERRASDPKVPGHDERQPSPDPEMSWVIDSVVIGDSVIGDSLGSVRDGAVGGDGLVWVQDYSNSFSADGLGVVLTGNVLYRTVNDYPQHAVVWQLEPGRMAAYLTLARFQQSVPNAAANRELFGAAIDDTYRLLPTASVLASEVTQPIPDSVRAFLGDVPDGVGALPATQEGSSALGPTSSSVAGSVADDPFGLP